MSSLMTEIKVAFDAADQYELFMGRWSRAAGEKFLDWLAPATGLRWLDVGCGTGAFTQLIARRCEPKSLSGADPAPAQIEHARKQVPEATFQVADAARLPFHDGAFDIVASALVINFIPDRAKAMTEMSRVQRPGGTVAAYLWKRDQQADLSPHAPMEQGLQSIGAEILRPPMAPESTPEGARVTLEQAGYSDIAITTLEVRQTFRDFDDYWKIQNLPFSPIAKSIAKLSDDQRAALRETMRNRLPASADGTISYSARALAFKAKKPAA
jgi:ubiquinone/menaquinone biosynthesis C-methylase UbiE